MTHSSSSPANLDSCCKCRHASITQWICWHTIWKMNLIVQNIDTIEAYKKQDIKVVILYYIFTSELSIPIIVCIPFNWHNVSATWNWNLLGLWLKLYACWPGLMNSPVVFRFRFNTLGREKLWRCQVASTVGISGLKWIHSHHQVSQTPKPQGL